MMLIGRDPIVHGAATDTEPVGDRGDGAAPVEFEQSQSATVGGQIVGRAQLATEAKALLRRRAGWGSWLSSPGE